MFGHLPVEVVAQDDDVLELRRQDTLLGDRVYQIWASLMKLKRDRCTSFAVPSKRVRAEVDRRAEDALESSDQSVGTPCRPVCMPKLSSISAAVRNRMVLALLLDGQSCEEDRNEAILAERHAEFGMPGDLKHELAVAPLIKQLLFRQSPDRQTAQDERTRAETEILILLFAPDTDKLDAATCSSFCREMMSSGCCSRSSSPTDCQVAERRARLPEEMKTMTDSHGCRARPAETGEPC